MRPAGLVPRRIYPRTNSLGLGISLSKIMNKWEGDVGEEVSLRESTDNRNYKFYLNFGSAVGTPLNQQFLVALIGKSRKQSL